MKLSMRLSNLRTLYYTVISILLDIHVYFNNLIHMIFTNVYLIYSKINLSAAKRKMYYNFTNSLKRNIIN